MKLNKSTIATLKRLRFTIQDKPEIRTNPFTNKQHTLTPEAVQLYDFITTNTFVCGIDYTRKEWDNARYYFAEKWPNEYYDLLD